MSRISNTIIFHSHIGITCDQMTSLIKSNCLKKLKILKFHSKQTYVFTNKNIEDLSLRVSPAIEYLEVNAEHLDNSALQSLVKLGSNVLQQTADKSLKPCVENDPSRKGKQTDTNNLSIKIPDRESASSTSSSPSTAVNTV